MKKLSEILLEEQQKKDVGTTPKLSTPTLILFNDVLDPEKVLQSPEIEKIVTYFFGRPIASVVHQPDNAEQLHDWFSDVQYRADETHAMIYPIKADFGNLTMESYSNQFSGPAYIQITSTGGTVYDVLTITCKWYDGVFRNDYYVIGAIVDLDDLEKITRENNQ